MGIENKAQEACHLTEKEESIMKEWYQLRKRLAIFACIQRGIFTFEFASIVISALFYYRLTIKPDNPVLYYSVAMGIIFLTAPCSAVYGGWYVDKTGGLRKFHIIANLFSIFGNLIYVVPYSKWYPILGRAMSGISDGIQPGFNVKLKSFRRKPKARRFQI